MTSASTSEPTPQKVIDRLLEKMDIVEMRVDLVETACWISRYSTGSHGYSQVTWWTGRKAEGGKTRVRLGHRVSWEALFGPVPYGKTVEHRCRVRRCINPEHLTILTNLENAQGGGGWNSGQPVSTGRLCGKGLHDLLLYPSGAVSCRPCQAERAKRKYPGRVASRQARRVK